MLPGGAGGILCRLGGNPGGGPGGKPCGRPGGGPGGNILGGAPGGPPLSGGGLNIIGGTPGGGPVTQELYIIFHALSCLSETVFRKIQPFNNS
jgi:hypothetical protein